jgi:asparagine synthase (glutamine-hydrolysing)
VATIVADQVLRGPDHQAVEVVGVPGKCAVLGHARLSILDLSSDANQPMASDDGRFHIVFNGEIYNYRELRAELSSAGDHFRTESDTEVLLAACRRWGPTAFARCNGMFAAVVYDRQQHSLLLARDRFGVKPLYYMMRDSQLYFASTGRALARLFRLSPNLEYVARGLSHAVYEDDSDVSQYEGLSGLPAGHVLNAMEGCGGGLSTRLLQYYDLEARTDQLRQELSEAPLASIAGRFQDTLEDAVSLRLRADVPVGVSVSGGLDSSSIASIAAYQLPSLTGFCYGSPEAAASEGPLVAILAKERRIDVRYSWVTEGGEAVDAFWRTLAAQDAPFPSGSLVAQNIIFQDARASGFKVLMGGQGGDEVLMGYHKYRIMQLRMLLGQRQYRAFIKSGIGLFPTVLGLRRSLRSLWWHRSRYMRSGGARHRLNLPGPARLDLGASSMAPLWHRQIMDVLRVSLPTLLRYEDRNSMGNSVESRLPFLDFRMVELGLALPDEQKLHPGWGKWILRSTMAGRLPDAIRMNPAKRGFDANQLSWIQGGLGPAIRSRLNDVRERIKPFVPASASIDTWYSDAALEAPGNAFCEAVSLLWLAER